MDTVSHRYLSVIKLSDHSVGLRAPFITVYSNKTRDRHFVLLTILL